MMTAVMTIRVFTRNTTITGDPGLNDVDGHRFTDGQSLHVLGTADAPVSGFGPGQKSLHQHLILRRLTLAPYFGPDGLGHRRVCADVGIRRSEERRVGKECR